MATAYDPGVARATRVEKSGERWTLVVVRELRHPPERVWEAITEPEHLREWAPYEADRRLDAEGALVELTWASTANVTEARVTRAEAPRVLEVGDMRWELERQGEGTRLTLWHSIDRRFVAWGAAGWHIALDVLERQMEGSPVERIAGSAAMRLAGWGRLVKEYTEMFEAETPGRKAE